MDPTIYYVFLIGGFAFCIFAAIACRTPTRPCPQCGRNTPAQNRFCRYCGYSFGHV